MQSDKALKQIEISNVEKGQLHQIDLVPFLPEILTNKNEFAFEQDCAQNVEDDRFVESFKEYPQIDIL